MQKETTRGGSWTKKGAISDKARKKQFHDLLTGKNASSTHQGNRKGDLTKVNKQGTGERDNAILRNGKQWGGGDRNTSVKGLSETVATAEEGLMNQRKHPYTAGGENKANILSENKQGRRSWQREGWEKRKHWKDYERGKKGRSLSTHQEKNGRETQLGKSPMREEANCKEAIRVSKMRERKLTRSKSRKS